jgi:glycosyltransferase involved in cell wall biosynthesis
VLVVDNASSDGTPGLVREFAAAHPGLALRLVDAHDKAGLSYARNVGVANTRAAAVAFCDHDDLVGDGWVAAMGAALRDHPVVACRFVWDRLDAGTEPQSAGGFQTDGIEQLFGYPIVAGVGGWQRWLWESLGGNDESMTSTGEDFDMSIRAVVQHGVVPYFATAAVYHVSRRDGPRATFRQARAYGRSSVVLYDRYGRGRADTRSERRRALRSWGWLVRHLPDLRDERRARGWARQAGLRVGRLEQSLKSRTLWP